MWISDIGDSKVGGIAQRAGARQLVLTHMGDPGRGSIDAVQGEAWAKQGYDGEVTVGQDLAGIKLA